jgi:AcrR family transcriptional regulator
MSIAAPPLAALLAPAATADRMTARILDAAYGHLLDFGIGHLSVEEVARRAGIARITIYRRFATKDELLRAVLIREGQRIFAQVDAVIAAHPSAEENIVEGFAATLSAVRGHPLVHRTLVTEPEMIGSLLITHGGAVIALSREYLTEHASRAQRSGQLPGVDPRGVAELAVRLSLSFLLTPDSCIPLDGEDDARAFARQYLLPAYRTFSHPYTSPDSSLTR